MTVHPLQHKGLVSSGCSTLPNPHVMSTRDPFATAAFAVAVQIHTNMHVGLIPTLPLKLKVNLNHE